MAMTITCRSEEATPNFAALDAITDVLRQKRITYWIKSVATKQGKHEITFTFGHPNNAEVFSDILFRSEHWSPCKFI